MGTVERRVSAYVPPVLLHPPFADVPAVSSCVSLLSSSSALASAGAAPEAARGWRGRRMKWLSNGTAIAIPPSRSRVVTMGASNVRVRVATMPTCGVRGMRGDVVTRHVLSSCVNGEGGLGALSVCPVPLSPSEPPLGTRSRPSPSAPHFICLQSSRCGMGVDAFAGPVSEKTSKAPTPLRSLTASLPKVVEGADVLAQPDARTKSGTPAPTIHLGAFSEAVGAVAKSEPREKSAAPTASGVPSLMTSV